MGAALGKLRRRFRPSQAVADPYVAIVFSLGKGMSAAHDEMWGRKRVYEGYSPSPFSN